WFCPSVSKDRFAADDPADPTNGYRGTTYFFNYMPDPTASPDPNPFRNREPKTISGLPVALVPRPTEAPVLWDVPFWRAVKEPSRGGSAGGRRRIVQDVKAPSCKSGLAR